jgi:hypothetical protein
VCGRLTTCPYLNFVQVFKKSTKKRKPNGYLMTNQCTQIRTSIGSWNVRTLFQKWKLAQLNREMDRYKLDILGVSEVRWNGSGQIKTSDGKMFLSCMLNDEDPHV